jgi:hypothetical protein
MSGTLHAFQAAPEFASNVVDEWSSRLKALLETKHLYQKTEASIDRIKMEVRSKVYPGHESMFDQFVASWEKRRLKPVMVPDFEATNVGGQTAQVKSPILLLTNVKLFCASCKTSEVFSPLWAKDVAEECQGPHNKKMPRREDHQLFFVAFQCQRCNGDPEGFIVRRSGYRLFLEGRSPIEQVDLPRYLPKKEAPFFSDAIVAYNAGKKLAGLFYLRTFLEQFCRRMTGRRDRIPGDELMEAYIATLPSAHRDYMPSFREWYDKLSDAIHAAREDDALFEDARSEIDRHFDIRRVHKIPETEPRSGAETPHQDEVGRVAQV